MNVVIDPDSAAPPYEQVREQFAAAIAAGAVVAGSRLPTVRALAAELGLAVNTVARAYRELEAAGMIETRGRAGTVVAARSDSEARARAAAEVYVRAARSLAVDRAAALEVVAAVWDDAG
jgi:DNA-binding transcriptional regulator YhcF (GntR family)